MRRLLVAMLMVCCGYAQTTVTGSIAGALGITNSDALTATCSIAASATFTAANGVVVTPSAPRTVNVTSGLLSVALLPVDTALPIGVYYVMTCHVPLQTSSGQNCTGSASLINGGTCVVGPGDSTLYLLVPTSVSPVEFASWYRSARPRGVTWQSLIANGTSWSRLLTGN